MSNQRWLVFFLTLKALCIRNLFHQDKWWMVNSIVPFWGGWGKTSSVNVQTSHTTPGPCIMAMIQLPQTQQSSPTLPTHRTSPPVIFSSCQRWNWSLRVNVLTALKRSRLNHRMWWRHWSEMTSNSASDHGNPTAITVSMQKGTTSKGMEANTNFGKLVSCGRRIWNFRVAPCT